MIELYTMPRCAGCEAVKAVLMKENIRFQEITLNEVTISELGGLVTDLRTSGHPISVEEALVAPVIRNPTTGDAIPASVLRDGRDIVAEVTRIL